MNQITDLPFFIISRDFGLFLRRQLKSNFPTGEGTKVNETAWTTQLDSLHRISENHHLRQHPLPKDFQNATGLTVEQCTAALSREFLEIVKKEHSKGFLKRIFGRAKD